MKSEQLERWSEYLGWAEFCYYTSFHSSINMSPYQALYGQLPATIPSFVHGSTSLDALETLLIERDKLLDFLKATLIMVQHRIA